MGTYHGKSLWKLSFQCIRFLSEMGGKPGYQLGERGEGGIDDLKRDVNNPMGMSESKWTRGTVGLSDT